MTTKYEDDVTGEQYDHEIEMERFGLVALGDLYDDFHVHVDKVHEDPEDVAHALHDAVDEWLEDWQQYHGGHEEVEA